MISTSSLQGLVEKVKKGMEDGTIDREAFWAAIPSYDDGKFEASQMRQSIEKKLESDPEGDQLLTEALEMSIKHGSNLDTLRRKIPDSDKLERIISFFSLRSKAPLVSVVTMYRLQLCFPERACQVAHRIKPRHLSRLTPEAFPHAMRFDGFAGLSHRMPVELKEAYCLYKAQKAAAFNKDNRDIVTRAALETQMAFIHAAKCPLEMDPIKDVWKITLDPKYGIFNENRQLADVLLEMSAEYKRIMAA